MSKTIRDRTGCAVAPDRCPENDIFEPWLEALDIAAKAQAERRKPRVYVSECRGPALRPGKTPPPEDLRNPKTGADMSIVEVRRVAEMTVDEIFKRYFEPTEFVHYIPPTDVLRGRAAAMLGHARELIEYYR